MQFRSRQVPKAPVKDHRRSASGTCQVYPCADLLIPGLRKARAASASGKPTRGAATRGPGAGAGKASWPDGRRADTAASPAGRPYRRARDRVGGILRRATGARDDLPYMELLLAVARSLQQRRQPKPPAIFRVTLGRTKLRYSGAPCGQ